VPLLTEYSITATCYYSPAKATGCENRGWTHRDLSVKTTGVNIKIPHRCLGKKFCKSEEFGFAKNNYLFLPL